MFRTVSVHAVVGALASAALLSAALDAPLGFYLAMSSDGVLLESSMTEVAAARALLFALGGAAALSWVAFQWFGEAGPLARLAADYARFLTDEPSLPQRSPPPLSRRANLVLLGVQFAFFGAILQTIQWAHRYMDRGVVWFDALVLENGLWETLTAVFLFAAGALFLITALRERTRFDTQLSFLTPAALGTLLLVGGGEEVSWGQHWLGFETPTQLRQLNTQGEANLHNLYGHWADNVQMIFQVLYLVALPVATRLFGVVRYLAQRLAVPVAPLVLLPLASVSVLLDSRARFGRLWGSPPWRISEARELLFALLVLCVAWVFWRRPDETKR